MSEAVWAATWPVERIQQRAFFTFGMDLLLSLNLSQVRLVFSHAIGNVVAHFRKSSVEMVLRIWMFVCELLPFLASFHESMIDTN